MKKFLLGLLIFIVILVLGVVIFLLTFDLNHYKHFVETQASNALGKTVEIKSLATKLSLIPTVKVEGVKISDDTQKEPLLEVPKLEAVIELTSLLQKQIVVQEINIPEATLVWTDKVKTTSEKSLQKANSKSASSQPKLWIGSITIDALKCKINQGKNYTFEINKIVLNDLSKFSFEIVYQGKTIKVNGNFGSILDLFFKKEELPITLTLTQDRASVKFNGKIADLANLKKINLQINVTIPNLSAFLKKWNIKNSKIPTSFVTIKSSLSGDLDKADLGKTSITLGKSDAVLTMSGILTKLKENPTADLTGTFSLGNGTASKLWGIKPLELETKIKVTTKTASFSEIKLNANRSDLAGNVQLNWEKQPIYLSGNLKSTFLDIYDILNQTDEKTSTENSKQGKTKIFGTDKLPFDLLKQINTNVHVNIDHLNFTKEITDYATIDSTLMIQNGELSMPTQIRLFGGNIQNQLRIQENKQKLTLKTEATGIQLEKIKSLSKNIQNSLLNFSISFEGTGENLHQLVSSAEGNIMAELTSGQVINKWFNTLPTTLNLLRGRSNSLTFSTQDQRTELLCGAINMPIRKGIITSQNQIALETNILNFILNGQIDLKEENLNLTMIPSLNQTRGMANELLNVTQSISLSGPWTDIKTGVNAGVATESLVQTAVQKLTGTEQKKTSTQATELCQKVLGKSLTGTKKTTQVSIPKKEVKNTTVQTNEKVDLKNQLIQSLSKVLTTPKKQ